MKKQHTVSGLWIGGGEKLPFLAELCIRSYMKHGVSFQLFTYRPYANIPEGVILRDANEIIEEHLVFQHESGSYALFADWFRNKFLYENGGIWTDLDVICISPQLPDFEQAWYAWQEEGLIAVGVIAFPPQHPVMEYLYKLSEDPANDAPWDDGSTRLAKYHRRMQEGSARDRRERVAWGHAGPNGFTQMLNFFGMSTMAAPAESIYPIHYTVWRHCYDGTVAFNSPTLRHSWAVHVWNELFNREPYAIEQIHPQSIVGHALRELMPHALEENLPSYKSPLWSSIPSLPDTQILIGVCSCVKASERRDCVRSTWIQQQVVGVQSCFFIGEGEALHEPDCVQLVANDSYDFLPEKVLAFFEYALANLHFDWLFKCDDDTYVHPERLLELCDRGADFIGNPWLETRGSPSGGAGYMMSRALVERIVSQRTFIPHTGVEDVLIGELAMRLCEASHASPRLSYGNYPAPFLHNNIITAHWLSVSHMRVMHELQDKQPSFTLFAIHPHWRDGLLFYPHGIFMRKEAGCMGEWSRGEDGSLTLAWFNWDAETLSPCELGYQSGEFRLYHPSVLSSQHISPTWWISYEQQIELCHAGGCETALLRGRKLYSLHTNEHVADILYHSPDSLMLKRPNEAAEFYTQGQDNHYQLWQAAPLSRRQKVGILYICTGRYDMFWDSFYEAAQKNLFLNHDVHYYVFTDSERVQGGDDVTIIKKPFLRWPYELLHRYHTFIEHQAHFENCDFLYFFNANCLPASPIGEEVFPDERLGLVATLHFGFCFSSPEGFTYERNPLSRAHIPMGSGYAYIAGGFNGGRTENFMRMAYVIKEGVDADSAQDFIACWHEESHYNRYLLDQSPLIVAPNYLLPSDDQPYMENVRDAFAPFLKNICRYKENIIDINYLKQLD